MTPLAIDQAVALYVAARHRRQRIAVLPEDCRPGSLDEAYAVQVALSQRLAETHGPVCGRKIGCTTPVMQRYLEIAHPCAGALYERRTLGAPATVPYADHWRPGVECEIAVRLGQPLPADAAPFDRAGRCGRGGGLHGRHRDRGRPLRRLSGSRYADADRRRLLQCRRRARPTRDCVAGGRPCGGRGRHGDQRQERGRRHRGRRDGPSLRGADLAREPRCVKRAAAPGPATWY